MLESEEQNLLKALHEGETELNSVDRYFREIVAQQPPNTRARSLSKKVHALIFENTRRYLTLVAGPNDLVGYSNQPENVVVWGPVSTIMDAVHKTMTTYAAGDLYTQFNAMIRYMRFNTYYCVICGQKPWSTLRTEGTTTHEPFVKFMLGVHSGPAYNALEMKLATAGNNGTYISQLAHLAGVCLGCNWSCGQCGTPIEWPTTTEVIVNMINELSCSVCVANRLSSILPPKPNRRELKDFRRKFQLNG